MKSKLTIAVALMLLCVGCMTTQQKQWTCDTAKAAYAAYQATIEAGRVAD